MVLKLVKYDLRSMLKSFVPFWAAVLVLSILNGIFANQSSLLMGGFSEIVFGLSIFLYVILIVAVNIIGIVIVLQRFYNGLLKDEGYLMFTLPAAPWQHVLSKGIAALIVVTLNALISALSAFVLMILGSNMVEWNEVFQEIGMYLSELGLSGVAISILTMIMLILSVAAGVYRVYASMALGHLAKKHRVGWSVAAYIIISFALAIIGSIGGLIFDNLGMDNWLQNIIERAATSGNLSEVGLVTVVASIIICLLQTVVFYIITERILAKKLNLE